MWPRWLVYALFASMTSWNGAPAFAQSDPRHFSIDVVELIRSGKELPGDSTYSVERDGYTYHFASAANKSAFEAEPTRFEVQMGGGCGRMGPLAGEGSTDRFAIHDGKLYVFASPQCREGFLKAPQKMIDTDDAPLVGDAGAVARGRELIEMAVKAHGGAAAIDGVKSYRQSVEKREKQGEKESHSKDALTIEYPARARDESCWNDACFAFVMDGTTRGAAFAKGVFDRPLAAQQIRALTRRANSDVLSVLKARKSGGFTAIRVEPPAGEAATLEYVAVWYDGMQRVLGVDPASGRVGSLQFTGRGGERGVIGTIERAFVDYETIDGITLPVSWKTRFDGGPWSEAPTRLTKLELNASLPPGTFGVDK